MAGTPRVWMAELLAEDQSQQTTEKYRQISSCLQQLRLPHVNCHRPATSSSQAKVLKLGIVVKQPWGTQRIVRQLSSLSHRRLPIGWSRRSVAPEGGNKALLSPIACGRMYDAASSARHGPVSRPCQTAMCCTPAGGHPAAVACQADRQHAPATVEGATPHCLPMRLRLRRPLGERCSLFCALPHQRLLCMQS